MSHSIAVPSHSGRIAGSVQAAHTPSGATANNQARETIPPEHDVEERGTGASVLSGDSSADATSAVCVGLILHYRLARRYGRRMRASVRRWVPIAAFMALTVAFGLASWLVLPNISQPSREGSLIAQVSTDRAIRAIDMHVSRTSPAADGPFTITINAIADGTAGDAGDDDLQLAVLFPFVLPEQLTCMSETPCLVSAATDNIDVDFLRTRAETTVSWQPYAAEGIEGGISSETLVGAHLTFQLDRPGWPVVNCTTDICAGNVPRLLVGPTTPIAKDAFAQTTLEYSDLSKFDWSTEAAAIHVTPAMTITSAIEVSDKIGFDRRVSLDGRRIGLDTEISNRTFLAGALIGLAGGTFVAAITELISGTQARSLTPRMRR